MKRNTIMTTALMLALSQMGYAEKGTPTAQLSEQDKQQAKNDDRGHRARPMTQERLDGVLKKYNPNDDQELTWAEFNDWRLGQFTRTDENGNDVVDPNEYVYEFEERLDGGYEEGREYKVNQTNLYFKSHDQNNDGQLQWQEFESEGSRIFAQWDKNKDEVINEEDFDAVKKACKTEKSQAAQCQNWWSQTRQDGKKFKNEFARMVRVPSGDNQRGLIKLFDSNNDDRIEREEFNHAHRTAFHMADKDRDGSVSQEEFHNDFVNRIDQSIEDSRRGAIKQTYVRFKALDDNEDGGITFEEFQISGKRIFTRWDKNEDDVISAADINTQ